MSCLKERKKKLLVLESESCSAVTKHEGLWDSLAVGPLLLLKFEGLCLKQALLFGFCMLRVWNGIPVLVQSLLFLLTLPLLLPQGSFCHYHPGEEVMWSCFCCHQLAAMLNKTAWVLGHSCCGWCGVVTSTGELWPVVDPGQEVLDPYPYMLDLPWQQCLKKVSSCVSQSRELARTGTIGEKKARADLTFWEKKFLPHKKWITALAKPLTWFSLKCNKQKITLLPQSLFWLTNTPLFFSPLSDHFSRFVAYPS